MIIAKTEACNTVDFAAVGDRMWMIPFNMVLFIYTKVWVTNIY